MFTITIVIIIINAIVSYSALNNDKIMNDLIFHPPSVSNNRQYYRFFTSGFIHADITHLLFNMLALYLFGRSVEQSFVVTFGAQGKIFYLLMYLAALPVALLPSYTKNKDNYYYRSLGASGAVSAVIFAGLILIPNIEVGLLFIPFFKLPGFLFGPLYLIISYYLERRGGGNINHSAHIWGALFGLSFVIVFSKLFSNSDVLSDFVTAVRLYIQRY